MLREVVEIWKDVLGYENLYQISSYGRVKGLERNCFTKNRKPFLLKERILKNQKMTGGHLFVGLSKDGVVKLMSVHRMVAIAFIDNPEQKKCVNHINGLKKDNRVENLEWSTHSENIYHAINVTKVHKPPPALGIKGKDNNRSKKVLCINTGEIYDSAGEAGRALGTYQSNISRVCNGLYPHYKKLKFTYI